MLYLTIRSSPNEFEHRVDTVFVLKHPLLRFRARRVQRYNMLGKFLSSGVAPSDALRMDGTVAVCIASEPWRTLCRSATSSALICHSTLLSEFIHDTRPDIGKFPSSVHK
jgi:hypothetical protein